MASIPAASIARLHTVFAATAFASALTIGSALHFKKIVRNDVAGYPDEWFPSVSATIGDWYPERNVFQILIALTSGPRFALVFLQYYLHYGEKSTLPTIAFLAGIVRTLSCGGWVYITSSDDHDVHDVMMVLYMVCNIPWMLSGILSTPVSRPTVRRKRKLVAGAFFVTIAPLVYFFIRHKVHRVPGAYTRYAFFEWGLIFFDVLYDSISELEFREADLKINLSIPSNTNKRTDATPASQEPLEISPNGSRVKPLQANDSNQVLSTFSNGPQKGFDLESSFWTGILSLASDVYQAYVFWSLLTALIPTLFYFSVWKLGIAGHELALFSVLSPLLLSLTAPYHYIFSSQSTRKPSTLLDYVVTKNGQVTTGLATLMGLSAFAVPSPGGRLLLVAAANMIGVIRQVAVWSSLVRGQEDVMYHGIVLGLGITLSAVAKQANRANNPIWPFINYKADGHNKTGIVLYVLAIYEYSKRPTRQSSVKSIARGSLHPAVAALPLGGLLFALHNLLSESSTLISWSWTGYSNNQPLGPVPHLHGFLTVGAMTFGLFLASLSPSSRGWWLSSHWWVAFGANCAYVTYNYRNWTGYAGGAGLAVFLMSIIPNVLVTAAESAVGEGRQHVVKTYSLAFFYYCILNLASVFTVAYAFVPGGVYFRERTDLVTVAQVACLLPAFRPPISSHDPAISFSLSRSQILRYRRHIKSLLLLVLSMSLLATFYRMPKVPPQPYKPSTRFFNAGIWTVHFGIDNEGHDSQKGMAKVIQDMELDIVGLLETDLQRTAFGHRDLTRYLTEELNYYVDIGPGPNSHTWGAALLSKFPIVSTKHHLLPSPYGELAPAIEAVIDIHGTEVLILVAHNGQEEDPVDRELQSTALAQIMAASERPVVFLGYVVTKPWMPRPHPYGIMVDEGNVFDIDRDDNDRWCEYIFYRGLYRTSYARISRGIITDTETQIGQFVLPKHGHKVTNDTFEARYLRSRKEELPVEHWFPMEYYGNGQTGGVNGHYYHVFMTPLYYKLPEGAIV